MTEPIKYRKKPVVVEVMGPITEENAQEIANWCSGEVVTGEDYLIVHDAPSGPEGVWLGSYMVHHEMGFVANSPAVFHATYEQVSE